FDVEEHAGAIQGRDVAVVQSGGQVSFAVGSGELVLALSGCDLLLGRAQVRTQSQRRRLQVLLVAVQGGVGQLTDNIVVLGCRVIAEQSAEDHPRLDQVQLR